MIVKTLEEVGKALGRTGRTIRNWRDQGVKFPLKGPYDVEDIKQQAVVLGLYERLGSDPAGVGAPISPLEAKIRELSPQVQYEQRAENLKLTRAKRERIEKANKRDNKDLLPAEVIELTMLDWAAVLRGLAVTLRQKTTLTGNEAADLVDGCVDRGMPLLEQRLGGYREAAEE